MKKFNKFICLLVLLCVTVSGLASCDLLDKIFPPDNVEPEWVDYASQLKLDKSDKSTLKWEVTVKMFIDGDTTHFYINQSGNYNNISKTPGIDGVLKARYLGVNTPESTGKIEPWGKKASNFTKSKLENAESIIIESDDDNWNVDSTGERFLVWVWYKAPGAEDYRNLNLEILQEGLAVSSKSTRSGYAEYCELAISQAGEFKMHLYAPANVKDPDFPYGDAQFMTLKELKINIKDYIGARVAFEAVIVKNSGGSVYVESYDEETGMYFGISAYYQTSGLDGFGLELLQIGNKLRFAGVVGEFNGSYQITDLKYDVWDTENAKNLALISEGNTPAYQEINYLHFDPQSNQGSVRISTEVEDENGETNTVIVERSFMEMAQDASVSMKNLYVRSVYTTPKGDSKGAMTLYCQDEHGNEIQVRTIVIYGQDGNMITASAFQGKTIDVKGTIDYYLPEGASTGTYQIQLFSIDDVTFH